MRDCAAVLIDHKNYRQTGVQQFALALRSRLLHRIKDFLKRNDRNYRRDDFLVVRATQHGFGNRERHLLSGTNDLRAADDDATSVHARQHLADACVNFLELDHVRLKCTMKRAVDRPQGEGDEVWVFLKCFLKSLIVAGIVQA